MHGIKILLTSFILNILAIIPARSGSKSIKDKNILSFFGKPLLVHSIEHAKASKLINRIILSTDSEEYATIGQRAGAEVPFLRPSEISQDLSTDLEVFQHALQFLGDNEAYIPDIIVHLRPTTPVRNVNDIDAMIRLLLQSPRGDSVRAVVKAKDTPFKMWFKGTGDFITPVINDPDLPEAYNSPRQALPQAYMQTASIDVIRYSTIMGKGSMTGHSILGYEVFDFIDIDYKQDFETALKAAYQQGTGKRYCFDLDGVIAHLSPENDYSLARPNTEIIEIVNNLFDRGNYIIIFTARGSATGIDWHQITREQLSSWGVKHHEFHTGKPFADYYIDDKNLLITQLLKS